MVVMPNHFHCIIENKSPEFMHNEVLNKNEDSSPENDFNESRYGMHNKQYDASLFAVMDWFKTMTTNEYIRGVKQFEWTRFNRKVWQRKFYDIIIRSPEAYLNISNYINDNPVRWKDDRFNARI